MHAGVLQTVFTKQGGQVRRAVAPVPSTSWQPCTRCSARCADCACVRIMTACCRRFDKQMPRRCQGCVGAFDQTAWLPPFPRYVLNVRKATSLSYGASIGHNGIQTVAPPCSPPPTVIHVLSVSSTARQPRRHCSEFRSSSTQPCSLLSKNMTTPP